MNAISKAKQIGCAGPGDDGEPCGREIVAHGLCTGHYGQRRRDRALAPLGTYVKGRRLGDGPRAPATSFTCAATIKLLAEEDAARGGLSLSEWWRRAAEQLLKTARGYWVPEGTGCAAPGSDLGTRCGAMPIAFGWCAGHYYQVRRGYREPHPLHRGLDAQVRVACPPDLLARARQAANQLAAGGAPKAVWAEWWRRAGRVWLEQSLTSRIVE